MLAVSWVFRFLVGTGLLVIAGAKIASSHSKYPLEVHQMFQQRQNHRKVAVGGSWSAWSHWSPCTRSCGGGVTMQTRDCQTRPSPLERRRRRRLVVEATGMHNATLAASRKPPQSQCVGVYKRFHICNDKECPPGAKDFRQLQCEAFNHKPLEGRFYTWVPYVDAPNKCELNCRAVGNNFYARLNKTVVDGTRCPGEEVSSGFSVCVSGMCKTVGCDGVVGSAKRVDACGVCGGDNSTCRLVSGLFTRPTLPVGYNLIAQIPRGACNITISEMKHSRNYLALRRPDGSFVINGNWAINWSGEYDAGGARFTYRRQDNSGGESISSPGPLLEPVDIMVIYQQPNPGIKYEYMLPMKVDSLGTGPASGMMPAPASPVSPSGNSALPSLVPPSGVSHPPDDPTVKDGPVYDNSDKRADNQPLYPYGSGVLGTESQNRAHHNGHQNVAPIGDEAHKPQPRNRGRKRKFTWKTVGFTECTKTCGGGIQTTITSCVREHNQQLVPDRRCASLERPNPQVIRCNIKPCPAEWVGGEWSECSVSCGEGIQTRNLVCQQEVTATLTMKVANGACLNPTNLPRTQKCIRPACESDADAQNRQAQKSRWQVGQWGKCSVPCGQGRRSRVVQCVGQDGENPVGQEECVQSERPSHEETCDMGSCPSSTSAHVWFYTEWTQQCSEECGTGVQTRKVYCSSGQEETCDKNARPDDSRACSSDKLCSGKWFTGPWGQCSTSCGHGRQTRDTVCVAFLHSQYRVVLDMNCPSLLKPETERACEARNCSPEWYVSDWSPCSRDCGSGVQKREVKCLDEKQQPSADCAEERRPPSKRACNTHDCTNSAVAPAEANSSHLPSRFKDDPVLNNGAGDQAVTSIQDEKPHKGEECVDTLRNCHLVVQARLCKLYKFYRTSCCHSCHKKM